MSGGVAKQPHNSEMGSSKWGHPTLRGKIREILKDYGECSKADIIRELAPFNISKEKITNALRDMKKRSELYSKSRGWYVYVGTNGVATNIWTTDETRLKWFSEAILFHNIKGNIFDCDMGASKWGSKLQDSKERFIRNGPGSIVLTRNYDTLQFHFSCKRPGFSRDDLLEVIAELYQWLIELQISGVPVVQYFEARNSRNIMIKELMGQTYKLEVMKGLVLKAYQDGSELQTESIHSGLAYSLSDLVNVSNNMKENILAMESKNIIANGVKKTTNMLNAMRKQQTDHIYHVEGELNQVVALAEKTKEISKDTAHYMSYVDSRLFELTSSLGEVKQHPVMDQVQMLYDLKEGFTLLVSKIDSIETKIEEKAEEEKSFRELTHNQRIQTLNELLDISESVIDIASIVKAHRSTIYRFLDDYNAQLDVRHMGNPILKKYNDSPENNTMNGNPITMNGVTPQLSKTYFEDLKSEYSIVANMSQDIQVSKVMEKLGKATSAQVVSILSHLKEGSVRRSLSRLIPKYLLSVKIGGGKKKYIWRNNN